MIKRQVRETARQFLLGQLEWVVLCLSIHTQFVLPSSPLLFCPCSESSDITRVTLFPWPIFFLILPNPPTGKHTNRTNNPKTRWMRLWREGGEGGGGNNLETSGNWGIFPIFPSIPGMLGSPESHEIFGSTGGGGIGSFPETPGLYRDKNITFPL